MRVPKRRILSLAGGTIWLVVAAAGFATISLVFVGTPIAKTSLTGVIALAAVLLGIAITSVRAASKLPGILPPVTEEERGILRHVAQTTVAEVIGLAIVNGICIVYRQFALIAPLDVLVVGLHFIPLARFLGVPRYYVMGALFCVVSVVTLVFIPQSALVGHAPAQAVVPGLACSVVVWFVAAGNLRQVFQMVREQQTTALSI